MLSLLLYLLSLYPQDSCFGLLRLQLYCLSLFPFTIKQKDKQFSFNSWLNVLTVIQNGIAPETSTNSWNSQSRREKWRLSLKKCPLEWKGKMKRKCPSHLSESTFMEVCVVRSLSQPLIIVYNVILKSINHLFGVQLLRLSLMMYELINYLFIYVNSLCRKKMPIDFRITFL